MKFDLKRQVELAQRPDKLAAELRARGDPLSIEAADYIAFVGRCMSLPPCETPSQRESP